MAIQEKDLRFIRKEFENKSETIPERIRIGNQFVDDFIFADHEAADIPINALRVIFNIVSIISNEQFRPEDQPKQLSLFDEEKIEVDLSKEKKLQSVTLDIKKKYGKNALLKGTDLQEGATTRERNKMIGGHNA